MTKRQPPVIARDGCWRCASFAHDASFTHSAIMDLTPPVSLGSRTFDLCEYSYHELAYLLGLDKPHYPLPAKYHVELDEDGVDVFAEILIHGINLFNR